jgi:hypothetical protein
MKDIPQNKASIHSGSSIEPELSPPKTRHLSKGLDAQHSKIPLVAQSPASRVTSEDVHIDDGFSAAKTEAAFPSTPVRKSARVPTDSQRSENVSISVGTDSPLVARHQQKIATSLTSMKEKLQECQKRVKHNHSAAVSYVIEASIVARESHSQLFVDSISPFASMKGIQLNGQNQLPVEMPHVRVTTYVNHIHLSFKGSD